MLQPIRCQHRTTQPNKNWGTTLDNKLVLATSIELLYRESSLENCSDPSNDFVRKAVKEIKLGDINVGIITDREICMALKASVLDMCEMRSQKIEQQQLLNRLKINCHNDVHFYEAMEKAIKEDLSETDNFKRISGLRKAIERHFQNLKAVEIISKADRALKYDPDSISDFSDFLQKLMLDIEPFSKKTDAVKAGITQSVNFNNRAQVHGAISEAQKLMNDEAVYVTGWQDLNDALGGGLRPETVVVAACQHDYKTSMNLSLFAQLVTLNKPKRKKPGKKPLALFFSAEDSLQKNFLFLYSYFRYDETRELFDPKEVISDITADQMTDYVMSKFAQSDFEVMFEKIDPFVFNFRDVADRVIELENQGYDLEICSIDYLSKLQTTDCRNDGPNGTNYQEQLARARSFFANRHTLFLTPHQISTEGKALLRTTGGVSHQEFVKVVAARGYTEHTKGLDRIYDTGIYIHTFAHTDGHSYLTVFREKMRFPLIVEEAKKYIVYRMPKNLPLPPDLGGKRTGLRRVPVSAMVSSGDEEIFAGI